MRRTATEILNDLALFYEMPKDRDLAKKIGVSATTLSNWKRRNSCDIDLIVANCPEVDINNLLRGLPLKKPTENIEKTNNVSEPMVIYRLIQDKDRVIVQLAEQIGQLKAELKAAKKETTDKK